MNAPNTRSNINRLLAEWKESIRESKNMSPLPMDISSLLNHRILALYPDGNDSIQDPAKLPGHGEVCQPDSQSQITQHPRGDTLVPISSTTTIETKSLVGSDYNQAPLPPSNDQNQIFQITSWIWKHLPRILDEAPISMQRSSLSSWERAIYGVL